jgi:arabinose-5-phosphate isomerase
MVKPPADVTSLARAVFDAEACALRDAAARLGPEFGRAVQAILAHRGKVVVCGVGKSGRVGEKLAATFSSTGTPSVFLHGAEAAHGDLGVCAAGDPVILISKSGSTPELLRLLPALREMKCVLIGIVGNDHSPLAREVDILLDASVRTEADPGNLVPTSSATVAMVLGDALAIALMLERRLTSSDFGRLHPGGLLGRSLQGVVRDVMHQLDAVAVVAPSDPLRSVIIASSRKPLGAACVLGESGELLGLITDGDVRRALEAHDDIRPLRAESVMCRRPVSILPDAGLREALRAMEDRPSQISVLPVVDETGKCLGLLRLHDLYRLELLDGAS